MSEDRQCTKCGQRKQLTEFVKDSRKKLGRGHTCTECRRKYLREWSSNPVAKAYRRAYAKSHPESVRDWNRKYCTKHRNRVRESKRAYRKRHPEVVAAHDAVW